MVGTITPERRRRLALGGILGPMVFVAAVLVTAAARPEYHHATQTISELGEVGASRAALMNYGGFLLYGVLIIGFAAGLHAEIGNGPADWLGPLLVAIYGLGYFAVAFAPCNPGCTGATPIPSEQAHFLISRVIFLTAVAGPLVLFVRLAKDPAWAGVSYLVLLLSVGGYLLFLLPIPGLGAGTQQRLFVGCTLGWILVLAWRLFRLNSPTSTSPRAPA